MVDSSGDVILFAAAFLAALAVVDALVRLTDRTRVYRIDGAALLLALRRREGAQRGDRGGK